MRHHQVGLPSPPELSIVLGRIQVSSSAHGSSALCRARHEYASRLVERGVPLAQVRDLLGHASILTTERYDNQRLEALQAAVARLEAGKAFDAVADATDKVSRIFQVPTEQSFADSSEAAAKILTSN